jgi:hypothetical protein
MSIFLFWITKQFEKLFPDSSNEPIPGATEGGFVFMRLVAILFAIMALDGWRQVFF